MLAAACADPVILARLGGPLGDAARAAAAEGAPRDVRAAWAAAVRVPMPPGMRGADPSWIEAGLRDLPARARLDVASGAAGDPVGVWLARWACAAIPPLPAVRAMSAKSSAGVSSGAGAGRAIPSAAMSAKSSSVAAELREHVALPRAELRGWLERIGADQLALAVSAAGPAALDRAIRTVGAKLRDAAARIATPSHRSGLGPARAAIERSRIDLGDDTLLAIGARALAPHTDALSRRQLAARFPHALGLRLLVELDAFSRDPNPPTWIAVRS